MAFNKIDVAQVEVALTAGFKWMDILHKRHALLTLRQ